MECARGQTRTRSRNMHAFIHNNVPSALTGSSGFPTDGERLLVSTASEAATEPENVLQCGPRLSGCVDQRWSDARAGMRDPQPVGTARGFLWDDSRANFGVGDSCHVVGSERNTFTV